mgnify:CR=1 FL=1
MHLGRYHFPLQGHKLCAIERHHVEHSQYTDHGAHLCFAFDCLFNLARGRNP